MRDRLVGRLDQPLGDRRHRAPATGSRRSPAASARTRQSFSVSMASRSARRRCSIQPSTARASTARLARLRVSLAASLIPCLLPHSCPRRPTPTPPAASTGVARRVSSLPTSPPPERGGRASGPGRATEKRHHRSFVAERKLHLAARPVTAGKPDDQIGAEDVDVVPAERDPSPSSPESGRCVRIAMSTHGFGVRGTTTPRVPHGPSARRSPVRRARERRRTPRSPLPSHRRRRPVSR